MRSHAVLRGIPITTTIDGLRAALQGLETLNRMKQMEVCSLQEYHRHAPQLDLKDFGNVQKAVPDLN
jgi:carbamoyl-phosphate synthase large subunit